MVWLDIEGSQYWMDQNSNRNFFNGLVSAMKSHGIHFGVYTNQVRVRCFFVFFVCWFLSHFLNRFIFVQNEWSQVMGLSFTGGSSLSCWCGFPCGDIPSRLAALVRSLGREQVFLGLQAILGLDQACHEADPWRYHRVRRQSVRRVLSTETISSPDVDTDWYA